MDVTDQEFERAVRGHYADVFRFALSLTKREAEASDLTQEAFYLLAVKGRQIQDASKLKSWLFTTCYREFLRDERHRARFPHVELSLVEEALPEVTPERVHDMDAAALMQALQRLDELYRVPVVLFYLQGRAYKDIAALLEVPVGTVMSRLARGKEQLRRLLANAVEPKPVAAPAPAWRCSREGPYD
jgi:RNA polymerase sigma-70 factor (ECF subfamily)